jgi:Peptidase A4 family
MRNGLLAIRCVTIVQMIPPARPRFRRSAPWIFRGAIAVTVLALIISTQLNASRRDAQISAPGAVIVAPFTGFGGYNWFGNITEIGAQWRVPTIASGSNPGYASTWIGVQNGVNNQFVQIGVTENDFGNGPNQYQAFWSDLAVGFSPQNFGELYPGDTVVVSMVRSTRGWTLSLVDKSRELRGKRFVTMASSVPFTQGEWIQEDPSPSTNTAEDLPYPKISDVEFQHLVVNGGAPKLNVGEGQVLIASSGAIRVPTVVRDDSFVLTEPTGAAAAYLRDEQTLDAALSQFDQRLANWNKTALTKDSDIAVTMSAALESNLRALQSQTWPVSSRSAIARLVQNDRVQLNNLKLWSLDNYQVPGIGFERFKAELLRNSQLVDVLRATLNLPPL